MTITSVRKRINVGGPPREQMPIPGQSVFSSSFEKPKAHPRRAPTQGRPRVMAEGHTLQLMAEGHTLRRSMRDLVKSLNGLFALFLCVSSQTQQNSFGSGTSMDRRSHIPVQKSLASNSAGSPSKRLFRSLVRLLQSASESSSAAQTEPSSSFGGISSFFLAHFMSSLLQLAVKRAWKTLL